ncbi:3-phosphoshikimate 1-carboxyvinyltransferase [Achromobacter ruhlandii]|uniref:3-phosphoshikimate 1-carboxyvinyltransferase n=1 Tax=Achromobacter ruhlandii TaxID=72557 RepID=A0ABM8M2B3_9BURK|nr:3-phosphoshikimate 1-carboxyvinyltransferase [Achromobacter ruhlandii]AKP89005.1 5-Enolpyruvylshikimate-3-phosphate synthase [Achromobacter xylosoxidans]AOU91847.1 5-enolpyruvylshikimate-3-phosphate synthase [Achromobacter ruhlandii]MCZ8432244.1 3-phosphoshikimate 1-carboxyvinyltransferase [Achromobacter ruhlandii]MDC6087027.1 3-phosphoshikimate 1-carboxyvinyltransferase [Achromobacter ruhlandii]MDC6151579.1 3-phosphoshikimate 1-carboxyvinyltransferase [Achromobacter ruhlandii]
MGALPFLDLPRVRRAQGVMALPGSKSISNRVLLLAAIAEGETAITGLLDSDDTRVMLAALRQLGVAVSELAEGRVTVRGVSRFPVDSADLFMGNAGTAIRPLTAALALMGGDYRLSGVPRMHERPIGDLVDALKALGARIDYLGQPGYPPLHIGRGEIATPAVTQVQGSVSSQFLTALLMAAPLQAGQSGQPVVIEVLGELISKPYIEITLNLMARFGVTVQRDGWSRFTIAGGARYRSPGRIAVEGDASTASYFLALGAIGGGPLRVTGVGADSIQGDVKFAETLAAMGASVTYGDGWIEVTGVRVAEGGRLKAFDTDFNLIPDAAMTAAALALYADGPCRLRNIGSWRVKETDRIHAMQTELEKLGARVESGPDWLSVTPPAEGGWRGAHIGTWDDHRMAMCFSLAAFGPAAVRILDPGCVSKTFPGYFDVYAGLVSA